MRRHRCMFAFVAILVCAASTQAGLTFYGIGDRSAFDAATTISVVETFDSADKDQKLTSFVSQGVTYAPAGSTTNLWVTGAAYNNFAVFVPAGASVLTASGNEDFTVSMMFASPVTAVGFDTYLNEYDPVTVQVQNADGWTSVSLDHDPTVVGFFGVTSSSPIHSLRWTAVGGEVQNTGIDNVQIGVVPVPAAALLGVLGLSAAGMKLRRRI